MGVIEALHRQTLPPTEIVVAHSGPSDPSARITDQFPQVEVLHSDVRWYPGAARNAGAAATHGDWIAFLDSDVLVSRDWMKILSGVIENAEDELIAFCGSIDCAPEADYWAWCSWWIACGAVHSYNTAKMMKTGPGGNMVLSDRCFTKLGGFREDLLSAEDADLHARLHVMGGELYFVPTAHSIHVFQNGHDYLFKRLGKMGRHAARLRRWHPFIPGQAAVRWPMLSLALWVVRIVQIYTRALRGRNAPIGNLIVHTPGIIAGLLVWNWDFTVEAFRRVSDKPLD